MMRRLTAILVVLLMTLLPLLSHAQKDIDFAKHAMTFDLPINSVTRPNIVLTFNSPTGYQASNEYIQAFIQGRSHILEYVPKNETLDHWTRIITVVLSINKKFQADAYTKAFIDGIVTQVKRSKLIFNTTKKHANFMSTAMALEYTTMDGSTELIYMVYYSGPYDSAGVQFTKKLDHWLEDNEVITEANQMEGVIQAQLSLSH